MKLPELKIGKLKAAFPIIQGGMAVKISMAELAAAVANEGGIGVIAGTALKPSELREEIIKARKLSDGIIGVNIMYAARGFKKLLNISVESGIDLIISGAGFSRDMFTIGKKTDTPVIPIVSSLKLARISEKLGAAAVVVEGGNAGGHLGSDKDVKDIIVEIKENINIPVIAAGDIVTPEDIKDILKIGVDGVQMGTRFLASREAAISDVFKELCVKAKSSDVIKIMSSVGLKANAIKTEFAERVKAGNPDPPVRCDKCLKHCLENFCIKDALLAAKGGDLEKGIFFTGEGIGKIDEILSVKEIFTRIKEYFSNQLELC
ncbi:MULTISPECIES: nitronate monooxygenase family protein [unclassified Halanaerobium]|uniref:NAD(P)H-dependent flavin oxidoreductase n=1 Tax=unclassified Halanaerobium TaxID=2641197 RepID=UPI000DF3F4DA|nr:MULTISPECIES: nitronate monooxygenase [unclassified Halanaerobium]RCW40563.1 NAD(P)H-dependent flavin oxidoreductase YrpB (nitropropane dioxygenase family) [Halanaerobium sp. MA284_MarDTE_T2]RCW78545.1 NAD(P)H-dependent flavin oxidoreductase YrpB (nitropropane dioxygenase family) [Halanaerobium sp. DL-01]